TRSARAAPGSASCATPTVTGSSSSSARRSRVRGTSAAVGFSSRRIAVFAAFALLAVPGAARAADAPGAPGQVGTWTEGDKDGIGTATGTASKAWLTLDDGELTEVYAPALGTPSLRDLQFVVSDGKTFAEREREDARHTIRLADPRSLTY